MSGNNIEKVWIVERTLHRGLDTIHIHEGVFLDEAMAGEAASVIRRVNDDPPMKAAMLLVGVHRVEATVKECRIETRETWYARPENEL